MLRSDRTPLSPSLPNDRHRHRRLLHDVLGDASQQDLRDPRPIVAPHDDAIDVVLFHVLDDRASGRAPFDDRRDLDSVLLRPPLRVGQQLFYLLTALSGQIDGRGSLEAVAGGAGIDRVE